MSEYIHIDLFSGVGGFHAGFMRAGLNINKTYYSEIDPHTIAVYKHKFKNIEYVGSVTDVSGTTIREKHPNAKIIVSFGFPCQDLSIAGRGAGLVGARSGLFFQAIRIIKEVRPEIFIFENVKGLLSSNNGKDFEVVLRTIADIGLYECEWQLVNTKWLLPQNRERVYFIGHLAGRSEPRVFPFREDDFVLAKKHPGENNEPLPSLTATEHKGPSKQRCQNLVIHKTSGQTTTVKENQTGILQAGGANVMDKVPNVIMLSDSGIGRSLQVRTIVPPLRSNTGAGHDNVIINHHPRTSKSGTGGTGTLVNKESCFALDNTPHIVAGTLRTHKDGQGFREVKSGLCPTIPARARNDGSGQPVINSNNTIRRLTPIECERLQGFEDNHTEYGDYDGVIKKISKTQRYKQAGNAVTVDIVEMIAKRLIQ